MKSFIFCPYYGDVHIMEVSMMGVAVLWRCSYYEVVYIMKVSILWRCSYYGGVHDGGGSVMEVFIL